MNLLAKVKTGFVNGVGITGLRVKQYSPEILLVVGIVSMGAAVVAAVFASKNDEDILTDHAERLEKAKEKTIVTEEGIEVEKTTKEINRAVRKAYVVTVAKEAKNYGPTVLLMFAAGASFIGMHNIQAGRLAAVNLAYTGLKEYIDRYEKNNIALNGQASHEKCKYGFKEVKETDENGVTVEKTVVDPEGLKEKLEVERGYWDQFAVFSRKTTKLYKGNPDWDLMTLKLEEKFIQDLVNSRGWATVNDALEGLGIDPTADGMILG